MATISRDKRPDGTYLVYFAGENMHLNHWHVASDGTVLSVKEGGDYRYKRSDVRRKIIDVLSDLGHNFDWDQGWKPR